jgi:nucleotide-binding universal stress UspA family protein
VDDAVMIRSTAGDVAPPARSDGDSAPFAVQPVDVGHVVVPLDGSPFAERALPVAVWVADVLGADVHLLEVVASGDDEGVEGAIRYLDTVCRRRHVASWDVAERGDVAEALAAALGASPGRMACLATHGRGRSATIGSVAVSLVERTPGPVMLVGPGARAVTATDAPVVVAVDGRAHDDTLVAVGLGWAARLARRLDIVTVVEAGHPEAVGGGKRGLARGPSEPESYVESLAARARASGIPVVGRVVRNSITVRAALSRLVDRTAALIVLGSPPREGLGRMVPGSCSASTVHDAAVPALVVPLPPGA